MKKLWFLILLILIGAGGFVYFSPMFEKIPPTINIETNGYTNLKNPIKVHIKDSSGIKYIDAILIANNQVIELKKEENPHLGKDIYLNLDLSKYKDLNVKNIKIKVKAVDNSKWNFLAGNEASASTTLSVDKTPPYTEIISNSYAIGKGGSAAAVVKIEDDNLKDGYILVNNKYKFKLTPFVKNGFYAALIAWPIQEQTFDAELIAEDLAGNKVIEHIPYYWRNYKYPKAKIKISDRFINEVATRVLRKMDLSIPSNPVDIFKKVNEEVRSMNEKELYNLTSKVYEDKINSFSIDKFNPLPGSVEKAPFGERRTYYYKNEAISFAIHKGKDLAKYRHARIYASNFGNVVASKYIGIYGNTIVLYHKLGLYSTYSHTFLSKVRPNDRVIKNQVIALTGSTGAVFGDHLHFGIYIQGYPVNPTEWMDKYWIKTNIINIINGAKRIINK